MKWVVEGLCAGFKDIEAISNLTVSFPRNEVIAIIGPSGCGKSTFIRCLNRMHEMIHVSYIYGRVLLNNRNIYDKSYDPTILRKKVGMVFQRANPFPNMSIKENVLSGFTLTNNKLKKYKAECLTEELLNKVGLWNEVKDRLNGPSVGLSGGQQQRLCIARALAVEPETILMDEPCSALDPIATAKIEDLIKDLRNKYTIIVVTHNMQQAARISDRTMFLLMGKLVEFNKTEKVFTNPDDERTRDYVSGKFG